MNTDVWEFLCNFDHAVRIMSVIVFTLAALTLFSYPFLERGSAAHVIAMINVVYIVILGAIILSFRIKCESKAYR